jgi:hypothetical protein
MPEQPEATLSFIEEDGDLVLYCTVDGKRIAKRYSGKPWVSLEPGYTVRGSEPGGDYNKVVVEYSPSGAKPQ